MMSLCMTLIPMTQNAMYMQGCQPTPKVAAAAVVVAEAVLVCCKAYGTRSKGSDRR